MAHGAASHAGRRVRRPLQEQLHSCKEPFHWPLPPSTWFRYGTEMEPGTKLAALRRGMLEPLVLASIERRQRYAAEIATALREVNFPVQEGTLYPLLNKLRRDGLVEHEWQESTSGPPRKYLSLTDAGRTQLSAFRDYLGTLTDMITSIGS